MTLLRGIDTRVSRRGGGTLVTLFVWFGDPGGFELFNDSKEVLQFACWFSRPFGVF